MRPVSENSAGVLRTLVKLSKFEAYAHPVSRPHAAAEEAYRLMSVLFGHSVLDDPTGHNVSAGNLLGSGMSCHYNDQSLDLVRYCAPGAASEKLAARASNEEMASLARMRCRPESLPSSYSFLHYHPVQ